MTKHFENSSGRAVFAAAATSHNLLRALAWSPVAAVVAWCALAFNPATYPAVTQSFRSAREYTFVEMFTAFAFLATFACGLRLCRRHARQPGGGVQALLFLGFALVALLAALEETQWGQPLLGYEIPAWMREANAQGEFTLHNIEGAQGRADIFYWIFCLLAAALYMPRAGILPRRVWRDLRAEPALLPLLGCIAATALVKSLDGVFDPASGAHDAARWTTEITEALIAVWAMAYAALKLFGPERGTGGYSSRSVNS